MSRLRSDLLEYNSKYVDENGTLKNRLGITNQDDLDKADRMITTRKLAKLYLADIKPPFDEKKLYSIHKYLFQDIYDFAGEIRGENIYKSFSFCPPQNIHNMLRDTLNKANLISKSIDSKDKLLVFITELYSDLDVIHPFREGNGRTLREFIRQYMSYICKTNKLEPCYLDFSKTSREKYISAITKADASSDYSELLGIFTEILTSREDKQKEL